MSAAPVYGIIIPITAALSETENYMTESDNSMIISLPKISAIYYGLLQCGYDFYTVERSPAHAAAVRGYIGQKDAFGFFSGVKQDTCEVYPYWPRAAILEAASFCTDTETGTFADFDAFYDRIMSAGNIADRERDERLWEWIPGFPEALADVLCDVSFRRYLERVKTWIEEQNEKHRKETDRLERILDACTAEYGSPVREIRICLDPIKCVYASDYHLRGDRFVFSSGAFRIDSVIHEFLHHVVHPYTERQRNEILRRKPVIRDLDDSYYLSGDEDGILNAFEEAAVRALTEAVMNDAYPTDLAVFLEQIADRSV